jgi:hypothetical protein
VRFLRGQRGFVADSGIHRAGNEAPSVAFGDSSPGDGGAEWWSRRVKSIHLPRLRGRCPRSGRRGFVADSVIDRAGDKAPSVAFGDSSPGDGGAEWWSRRVKSIPLPRLRGRCPRSGRRGFIADSVIDRAGDKAPSVAFGDSSPEDGGAEW